MRFDCGWRLNRRTFDPGELRGAVEAVAKELGVARVEWRPGGDAERLEASLWLPAELVRAHDLPRWLSTAPLGVDLFPTQLAFSFERESPEPLVVEQFSLEEGEALFDLSLSGAPARTSGGVAVGSTVFYSRHSTWQAFPPSGVPEYEDGYFHCLQRGEGGELWVGAEDGALYRKQGGAWTRLAVANESIDAMCVVSPTPMYLGLKSGGVVEFDGEKVVRRWPELYANRLVHTTDGVYLFRGEELLRLEDGQWRKVRLSSDFLLFALAVDRRRRLWLANHEAVFLFEGDLLIPTSVRCEDPIALAVHDENDIWAAGSGGQFVHWDGKALVRTHSEPLGTSSMVTDGCGRAWLLFDRMFEVRRSSWVSLHITSNRSSNRDAWGALAELCARVATRLDGYVLDA